MTIVEQNAGVSYTASILQAFSLSAPIIPFVAQNLRNCAAQTSDRSPNIPESSFWAELNAVDYRFAVQRSVYAEGGQQGSGAYFNNPTGIWGNFYDAKDGIDAFTGLIDNSVTGVQTDVSPATYNILYGAKRACSVCAGMQFVRIKSFLDAAPAPPPLAAVTWTSLYGAMRRAQVDKLDGASPPPLRTHALPLFPSQLPPTPVTQLVRRCFRGSLTASHRR